MKRIILILCVLFSFVELSAQGMGITIIPRKKVVSSGAPATFGRDSISSRANTNVTTAYDNHTFKSASGCAVFITGMDVTNKPVIDSATIGTSSSKVDLVFVDSTYQYYGGNYYSTFLYKYTSNLSGTQQVRITYSGSQSYSNIFVMSATNLSDVESVIKSRGRDLNVSIGGTSSAAYIPLCGISFDAFTGAGGNCDVASTLTPTEYALFNSNGGQVTIMSGASSVTFTGTTTKYQDWDNESEQNCIEYNYPSWCGIVANLK